MGKRRHCGKIGESATIESDPAQCSETTLGPRANSGSGRFRDLPRRFAVDFDSKRSESWLRRGKQCGPSLRVETYRLSILLDFEQRYGREIRRTLRTRQVDAARAGTWNLRFIEPVLLPPNGNPG